MAESLARLVAKHPFCEGMAPDVLELLSGCAMNVKFTPGQRLFSDGDAADVTFLVRSGRVGFEIHQPGAGPIQLETAEPGEIVGWSWLFPPYRWHFDAVAIGPVRAISLDGACLRKKCEADPAFGYDVTKRILQQAHLRLERSRMQGLDLYGASG